MTAHCVTCACFPVETVSPLPSLTGRQALALNAIRDAIAERGYPPSMRELGEAIGVKSPSTVAHVLVRLSQKGYIRRDPKTPSAIVVLEDVP